MSISLMTWRPWLMEITLSLMTSTSKFVFHILAYIIDGSSIDVLLRLLKTHQTTAQHPNFPQATLYSIVMSLSVFLIHPYLSKQSVLVDHIHDVLTLLSDSLTEESRMRCISTLRNHYHTRDSRLSFIFGFSDLTEDERLRLVTNSSTRPELEAPDVVGSYLKTANQLFSLRRWEMMQDATPLLGENDASLSLTLFGARKSVL